MKIKTTDYTELKNKINAVYEAHKEECQAHKAKHSAIRYAWDMLHLIDARPCTDNPLVNEYITDRLYKYLHDSHIQTALLAITKEH